MRPQWKVWPDTDEHGDGPEGENGEYIVGSDTTGSLLVTCGRQAGALEKEMVANRVATAVNAHDDLLAVLKEFIKDVETVGIETLRSTAENEPGEWPDLLVTYHHAVQALKGGAI